MKFPLFQRRWSSPFWAGTPVLLLTTLSLATRLNAPAQNLYTGDGDPTAFEEEIRWRVNRGRFDSASENLARDTSYNDIPSTAGPLAPSQSLTLAARHHSEDMARNNVFQHNTVPGSSYYDPVTQPLPWDRFRAEGYSYSSAAENIAAGYTGAEATYLGWWNSSSHRKGMYNSGLCEIGNGYFYWSSSTYRRYYTMDLGRRSGSTFFTDTFFHDTNGNGVYDGGEGISGVAVRLMVGASVHSAFDISGDVGAFAVPFQSIASGTTVTVVLSNTTAANVTLSIPADYSTLRHVTLAAGQTVACGTFTKPDDSANSGLRNLTPLLEPPPLTQMQISFSGSKVALRWASESALQYQPQATCDGQTWTNLTATPLTGTGEEMTLLDPETSSGCKLYRLLITGP